MEGVIHGISLSLQGCTSWTLVIHNTTNGIDICNVDTSCNMSGASCSRVITVCSTVRTEGICTVKRVNIFSARTKNLYYRCCNRYLKRFWSMVQINALIAHVLGSLLDYRACIPAYWFLKECRHRCIVQAYDIVLFGYPLLGDIELGSSKEVVIAWWGIQHTPPRATFLRKGQRWTPSSATHKKRTRCCQRKPPDGLGIYWGKESSEWLTFTEARVCNTNIIIRILIDCY